MKPFHSAHHSLLAILLLVFGVLWIIWLVKLPQRAGPRTRAYAPANASHLAPSSRRCRDVLPHLRTILLVVTVCLLLSATTLIAQLFFHPQTSSHAWVHRGVPMTVLVLVFVVQLAYLVSLHTNRRRVRDGCGYSTGHRVVRGVLLAFAGLEVVMGGWLLVPARE